MLTRQVALAVHHTFRLARRAARERDQAGILRIQLHRGGGLGVEQLVGGREHRALGCRRRELAQITFVGQDQLGGGRRQPQTQVVGPELLVAWQRDGADPEAGDHSEHPFRTVADQREHHIATPDAAAAQLSRQLRASLCHLPERPLPAAAVPSQLDQRPPARWSCVDYLSSEVHGGRSLP